MRNLKRALSLVLATVMVIGMMVVGASAASYKDDASIDYKEAVDVMTAVGMIEGWDGSFGPELTIDRAGAAKLIAYLKLGKATADSIKPTEDPFNDVDKNAWYAGYVAYCKSEKLLEGYNGNFDPNGTMTAYGFAKLLLGALGYDAKIEGLTGDSWEVATARLAINNGLFAGNDGVLGNSAMTRQEACLYAFNALKADTVNYTNRGTEITLSDGTTIVMGASPFYYVTRDERATGADYAHVVANPGRVQLCETLYRNNANMPQLTVTNDAVDKFGRTVSAWEYKGETIGSYAGGAADYTYTVTSTKVTDISKALKDIDSKLETVASGANATAYIVNGSSAYATSAVKLGDTVEVYLAADGKVAKVVVLHTELAKVTRVTKATGKDADYTYMVTVGNGNYKDTALTGFDAETMVKDSYVLITKGNNVAILAEPVVVTGKMTSKAADNSYLYVDGTKYTYADTVAGDGKISSFTNTYDFYLDANGYVVGTKEVEAVKEDAKILYVSDFKFVAGTTFTADEAKAAVTYLDGTTAIVNIVVDSDKNINLNGNEDTTLASVASSKPANGFYAYTADSNGNIKSLNKVGTAGSVVENTKELVIVGQGVFFNSKNAEVTMDTDGKFYATADTKVITLKDGKATTVTGYSNFAGKTYVLGNDVDAIMYVYDGKILKEVYLVDGASMIVNNDDVIGWHVSTGDIYYDADLDDNFKDVVYFVDGENETFKVAHNATAHDFATIKVDSDGVATLSSTVDHSTANATAATVTGTYFIDEHNAVKYFADDVKFYDVTNVEDNGVVEIDTIEANSTITYVTDGTDVTAVYVTYLPQEDGMLAANDGAYCVNVLGLSASDWATGGSDNWRVIQYTADKDYTARAVVARLFNAEGTEILQHAIGIAVGEGPNGFYFDIVNEPDITDPAEKAMSGDYTYTFTADGVVISTGSFTI